MNVNPSFLIVAMFLLITLFLLGVTKFRTVVDPVLEILNKPWVLLAIPCVAIAVWLGEHPDILIQHVDHPYALAAIPVVVASFFLVPYLGKNLSKLGSWIRKTLSNKVGIFWAVTIIFMIVSVLESGQYFNAIEHNTGIREVLGYASALVIDLVAVVALQARIEAMKMRDQGAATLYLWSVIFCACVSGYANLNVSIHSYQDADFSGVPGFMQQVNHCFGVIFPMCILIMSFTAEKLVDKVVGNIQDAKEYKDQQGKQVALMRAKKEIEQDLLKEEQEMAKIQRERNQLHAKSRFFIFQWIFPAEQQFSMQEVQEAINKALEKQREDFENKFNSFKDETARQIETALSTIKIPDIETAQTNIQDLFNVQFSQIQTNTNERIHALEGSFNLKIETTRANTQERLDTLLDTLARIETEMRQEKRERPQLQKVHHSATRPATQPDGKRRQAYAQVEAVLDRSKDPLHMKVDDIAQQAKVSVGSASIHKRQYLQLKGFIETQGPKQSSEAEAAIETTGSSDHAPEILQEPERDTESFPAILIRRDPENDGPSTEEVQIPEFASAS